jgi:hypothetical protein
VLPMGQWYRRSTVRELDLDQCAGHRTRRTETRMNATSRMGVAAVIATCFGVCVPTCSTPQIEGRLFISGVQSSNSVVDALAVDFISTQGNLSTSNVRLTVATTVPLQFEAISGSPNCLQLPESGRVELLAAVGQIGPDARVSVTAHRDSCDGTPLDTAVWPTTSATRAGTDAGVASADAASIPVTADGPSSDADLANIADSVADGPSSAAGTSDTAGD